MKGKPEILTLTEKHQQYSNKNVQLQDEIEAKTEEMENLRNQVSSIETQHSELEAMYAQLSKNYDRSTQTLNDVNKERRQLYEDASRNERLLNEQELEIKELKKCYNLERVNYDKIKSRFSQVEIEYENLEIIKKKEVWKFEVEKETIDYN